MPRNAFPQRLVILDPAGAEIAWRLGAWNRVVGIPHDFTPPRHLAARAVVSGSNHLSILRLEPDLVVANNDSAPFIALLAKHGLTLWAMKSHTLADLLSSIRMLGQIVHHRDRAHRLADRLEKRLQPVKLSNLPRPRIYFEVHHDPMTTCPPWVSELIHRAGGEDIFTHKHRHGHHAARAVTPLQVEERDPDLILTLGTSKPMSPREITRHADWSNLRAAKTGQVMTFPPEKILHFGPALLEGYTRLKREIKRVAQETLTCNNSPVARSAQIEVPSASSMTTELHDPHLYINRELSWIAFNRRVLEEAQDVSQPLLERLRFLGIVTSNLDEFFEVRVAGIKQQIEHESNDAGPDGLSARQTFEGIRKMVTELINDQYTLWRDELRPGLAEHGIILHDFKDLSTKDQAWATKYFKDEVYPVLTPLAFDAGHPFPQLRNKSHNLLLRLRRPEKPTDTLHAVVQIPRVLPRLVRLPHPETDQWHYILIQNLIQHHIHDLFPGLEVEQVYGFRITRNSDLYIDDEEADNLLRTIEDELRKRAKGNAVRLEVESGCPEDLQRLLLDIFKLTHEDVYLIDGPLNFLHLMPLASIDALASLRDKPYIPVTSPELPAGSDYFEILRKKDVLLHHPYESFTSVVEFLAHAAKDPSVLAIKMTLYRTSGDSPIVRALIEAAEKGKQVTVLVELRARFDEANNINWARQLEEAGVHVVYGLVGLKTHCKVLCVVRRDDDKIRHYLHLGTGNYHPSTARFYTDLSLLTTNAELGEEVSTLFNTITGLADFKGVKQLLVAPFHLHDSFLKLVHHERDLARDGKPGRIIIKVNSLVDETLIQAMYEASQAGVKIDLIVRGICCLRPGVAGVSENIRVISIVGRFLEHSRIYYFGNNGDPKVYLGSADWMPRNLFRRIEVVFPVLDPILRARVTEEILPTFLHDCVKARVLGSDGIYTRATCAVGQTPSQAQLTFRNLARESTKLRLEVATPQSEHEIKIIPLLPPAPEEQA